MIGGSVGGGEHMTDSRFEGPIVFRDQAIDACVLCSFMTQPSQL